MFGADSCARVSRRDPRSLDVADASARRCSLPQVRAPLLTPVTLIAIARRSDAEQRNPPPCIATSAAEWPCNAASHKLRRGAPWSAPHEPQETPPGSLGLSERSPSPSNRDGKIRRERCHDRPCAEHFVARGATKRLSYNGSREEPLAADTTAHQTPDSALGD